MYLCKLDSIHVTCDLITVCSVIFYLQGRSHFNLQIKDFCKHRV